MAAALWLLPLGPDLVDRWYAFGVYPVWQRGLTSASNLFGFAGLDLLLVVVIGWILAQVIHAWRRARPRKRARVWAYCGLQVLACAAVLACWFMTSWGLNYRRTPLTERLAFDRKRVDAARVREVATAAVGALNGLQAQAHAEPWPTGSALVARLAPAFAQSRRGLDLPSDVVPGRPKFTLLGPYFRAAGIAGFTNPFLLEVMLTPDALPFEQPAMLAHEWAHLAGLTDEAEAGFLGWLTCMRGDAQVRYAGWLELYPRLIGSLDPEERRRLTAQLSEGVRADYRAINARLESVRPMVRDVAWAGYDRFLRAHRVPGGIQSYDAVTRLVAGMQFDADWQPRLRR